MAKIALSNVNRKDRNTWRGRFAFLFNKQAGGKQTQGIIAVWYAWITAESGKTIYGNNPLNLTCGRGDGCYVGQNGWYQFPGNSRKFASFATPEDGARGVVNLLANRPQYRYPPIIAAARAGDWQKMIVAISNSCWVSCLRPGYTRNGVNSLFGIWNGLRKTVAAEFPNLEKTPTTGNITPSPLDSPSEQARDVRAGEGTAIASKLASGVLGGWGNQIQFPVDHILTTEDVQHIMTTLTANGWFNNDDGTFNRSAAETTRVILLRHVGEPWNKAMQDALQKELLTAAEKTVTDPLTAIAQSLSTFGDIIRTLFDPQTYVRTGALLVGILLLITGFKMLMDATRGSATVNA